MSRFSYRVYYNEHGERSRSDPFWSRKSSREIERARAIFASDLRLKLAGQGKDALIQTMQWNQTSIDVVITSDYSESEVRDAVRRTLQGLGLDGYELF
jgi:hypothetical protein